MSTEVALTIITGVFALSVFAQYVLPFIVEYFGTEQDRWFSRGIQRHRLEDERYIQLYQHLTETTKTQAQIVATLQAINQSQTELNYQIATIDRSLVVLAEKYTEISADIADVKDYAERVTDLALGLSYERRKNSNTKTN